MESWGHSPGGAPSRSLYPVILQAFPSLWMERRKEKPYSPRVSDLPPDERKGQETQSEVLPQVHQQETGSMSQDGHSL